jgi:hypothetical protein
MNVRYLVDAKNEEERRYHEIDPDFEELTDELPSGDYLAATTFERRQETVIEHGRFRNQVGLGLTSTLEEGESDLELLLIFLDERDVIDRDIEDWTREDDYFTLWRDQEIETDGRIVTITGKIRTRDILEITDI